MKNLIEKIEKNRWIMFLKTSIKVGAFLSIAVWIVACLPTDETLQTDNTIPIGDLPDPAPGGGCPDGSWDKFDNSESPFMGGEKDVFVEVSIAVYFRCPHCVSFALQLMELYKKNKFKDYVRLYFHHFPLSEYDIHRGTVAANNQSMEAFWKLHDEIMIAAGQKNPMSMSDVIQYAEKELKLDMDQFNTDIKLQETYDFIDYEQQQALDQGLTGTPSVWICGYKIKWGDLENAVDHFLNK